MTELTKKQNQPEKAFTQPAGLEDIVATDSSICFIDGPRSRLIYRGYSIHELAAHSTFEEVAYLLYFKRLPTKAELKDFQGRLAEQREIPKQILERMITIPKTVHPMSVLRTMVSALSFYDDDAESAGIEPGLKKAIRLTAQLPGLIAGWERIRNNKFPVPPKKELGHSGHFLYLLQGKDPDPAFAKALDLYLVLLADHELNASTFASRVTASTLSDFYSAMTTAIGALKGPLHGGANEQVIKMVFEIREPSRVDAYLEDAFAKKKKIMGFGHRVYKVQDPRSPILKESAREICSRTGNERLFQILERIEQIVVPAKKLPSNVDFYSAALLYCIGIPAEIFTPMFLMSRISGYSAHYLEQIGDNRLIRPRANYTGSLDSPYIPIENR